jgi:Transposase DDE domain group 1
MNNEFIRFVLGLGRHLQRCDRPAATYSQPSAVSVSRGRLLCLADNGAKSWSRVERIVAGVEAGADGPNTRFIVTNLKVRNARVLYEDVYCLRGQAENHIKS